MAGKICGQMPKQSGEINTCMRFTLDRDSQSLKGLSGSPWQLLPCLDPVVGVSVQC